jgi:hypothetical protein
LRIHNLLRRKDIALGVKEDFLGAGGSWIPFRGLAADARQALSTGFAL